jgi:hypothetical protein
VEYTNPMDLRRTTNTHAPDFLNIDGIGPLFWGRVVPSQVRPAPSVWTTQDNVSQLDELRDILTDPPVDTPSTGGLLFSIGAAMVRAQSDATRRLT